MTGRPAAGPLTGLRVLDFTTNISGPFATRILADLGADVIKVERATGDDARRMPPVHNEVSAAFVAMNRGKRSVVLDLKRAADVEAVRRLIRSVDVLVENMRPGRMAALGLGFEAAAALNPRLIYCSISGYGQTGPLAGRPAYDVVVQARTGIMSITGEAGGEPIRVGPSIVDLSSGMWAANAICAALWKRDALGRAQHLDVSLFEAGLAWMSLPFAQYEMTGEIQSRMGAQTPLAAPADCYPTADGHVIVAVLNDVIWQRFCTIDGFTDLATREDLATNARRCRHRDALTRELRARFRRATTDEWLERLATAQVPSDRIGSVDGLRADPQLRARNGITMTASPELERPLGVIDLPIRNSAYGPRSDGGRATAPALGEHTRDVLDEIDPRVPHESSEALVPPTRKAQQ
jgi:crotonobetainyl-CoA:carnitine CoA-transferase CaiB-like acyl-CoA transferase